MKFFDVPVLSRLVVRFQLILFLALAPKLAATTTNFFESFENGLSGWTVADLEPLGTTSYWAVVSSSFGGTGVGAHSGTNKAYCSGVGYIGTTQSPNYQDNMNAVLSRTIDLTGYTNATLKFWYKIPGVTGIEPGYDFAQVWIDNTEVWEKNRSTGANPWTQVILNLDAYIGASHNLRFVFVSDENVHYEGWYLDDILVTDEFTPPPPPPNDNFLNAPLLNGAVGMTNLFNGTATFEAGESLDGFSATNSVWFKWTPPLANGTVTFRTGGSTFDTILCVYSGGSYQNGMITGLTPVGCDDNGDTNGGSLISFPATNGVIYRISVRGVNNAHGVIHLEWNQPDGIGVDMLPDISLAVSQADGYLYGWYLDTNEIPGHTLLRASTATVNIGTGPLELIGSSTVPGIVQRIYRTDGSYHDRDVDGGTFIFHTNHQHLHFQNWLNFFVREILPSNGVGNVVAAGDKTSFAIIDFVEYDTSLPGFPSDPNGVYSGGLVQGISVGWGDVYDGHLPDQWIDVTGVPAGRYWLEARVDPQNLVVESNESNNVARILVDLSGLAMPPPPNDNFANAIALAGPSAGAIGSSVNTTHEGSEPVHDPFGNPGGGSIWYKWTAPSNMSATISTEGSGFNTVLAVYTGSALAGLVPVPNGKSDDVHYPDLLYSQVTFNANGGTTYKIAVDGLPPPLTPPFYPIELAQGGVELSLNPAWNNDLNRAIELTNRMSGSVSGSTRGATRQAGEPLHSGVSGSNSIWYVWTAPTNGPISFETTGSGFDTVLAVYTGSSYPLTLVAENNNIGANNSASRVIFDAVSNTTYRIAVDGFPGSYQSGVVKLSWNGPMPPTIVSQPVGSISTAGAGVQFNVGVDGAPPFHYQWRRSATNLLDDERISGTTGPMLTIGKAYLSDQGVYLVVITNAWGSVTSAPANLIINENPHVVYANDYTALLGGIATVPIYMQATGNVRSVAFSLDFDPALLANARVTNGANTAGATLTVDSSQASTGELGVTVALPAGQTLPFGSALEIARVTFDVSGAAASGAVSAIGFGNQPVARSVLTTNGAPLVALFDAGSVTLESWTATASGQIMGNGSFQLSLIGPPSHTYVIEATINLMTQLWVPVSTNQTSLSGLLQFLDTDATNRPYRFFRARMVQ